MLQDQIRLGRFKQAIFDVVRPGDEVIDLGTGTGILAIWAAKAGAKKVYAIEESDTATAAESVVRANGFTDQITVLHANSREVRLPRRADVLIAELVGHFVFEEGIVEYLSEVRDALLKPDPRIIPAGVDIFAAPLELGPTFEEVNFWNSWKELDLSPLSRLASNSAYVASFDKSNVIAEPQKLLSLDFAIAKPLTIRMAADFPILRSARLDAVGGWFSLLLTESVVISTGPCDPGTHWKQCVFPLEAPVAVRRGDVVRYSMEIEPFAPGSFWRWELQLDRNGKTEKHEFSITHASRSLLLEERF